MNERIRLTQRKPPEHLGSPCFVACQPLVLAHHPSDQEQVHVPPHRRLTAAQNAHDLEGMLACFHQDYSSEQPLFPARTFQGIDQLRANWSALLEGIPDFHGEILRSAADGGTVFVEIVGGGVL